MRKPSITIPVEASTRSGTRSKRAHTMYAPPQASKRARTQSDVMAKETFIERSSCSECKKKDKAGNLMNCTGNCSNKIHVSCLPPLFRKTEQTYECNSCQSCSICKNGFLEGEKLLKCYLCFTCYHSYCYRPTSLENIRMIKEKRFCCGSCQHIQKATPTKQVSISNRVVRAGVLRSVPEAINSEIEDFLGFSQSDLPTLPTRRSRSVEPAAATSILSKSLSVNKGRNSLDGLNLANNYSNSIGRSNYLANKDHRDIIDDNNNIPNASKWTKDEVYEYFKEIFPRHAHVFEDEEIDGEVLYQLERADVVERFKLKIGPSLKIYSHILKMQTKLSNRS